MLMKEKESLEMIRKSEIRKKIDLIIELKKNGISCSKVLKVIEEVDRNLFIDESLKSKSNLNTHYQLMWSNYFSTLRCSLDDSIIRY